MAHAAADCPRGITTTASIGAVDGRSRHYRHRCGGGDAAQFVGDSGQYHGCHLELVPSILFHRGYRNIGIKFGLALAMLGALGYFVAHLVGSMNDTRLVLAELLVQMQAIHTFDLPRRKDLGYSMTIGLILIGVAGTLSQTLAFAPLLLLFLAIAIPVLFLDYRSRLLLAPLPD